MAGDKLKNRAASCAGTFMAALLLVQPLLDVLSYFMAAADFTEVTTALRMGMLVTVSLYGFCISGKKWAYAAMYSVIGGFWLLHMLNCFRVGYADPVGDAAEYLKLIQLPLWTASFLTVFRRQEELELRLTGVLAANLAIILLVIGLSYLTGRTAYTYDYPDRGIQIGVLGWFGVPNAQSALLCVLAPGVLLWGLRTERLWAFCLCCVSGLGLLYLTGTRLTFYMAVLVAAVFAVLIPLGGRHWKFCLPVLVCLALLLVFRGISPMAQRKAEVGNTAALYQEKVDSIMGEDRDFVWQEGEEIPQAVMEKLKTVYVDVYGGPGIYQETLLEDLIGAFGLEKVMAAYQYSTDPPVISDGRARKLKAMDMVWEKQDLLTRLLGVEYSKSRIGAHIYDPENDFPALMYFTGYLGIALYGAFFMWVLAYAALAFFRRFPALLKTEFLAAGLMLVIGLAAAQFSGQVLRKPNVTVYLSFACAALISQAESAPASGKLRPGHERNPAVSLKKIG